MKTALVWCLSLLSIWHGALAAAPGAAGDAFASRCEREMKPSFQVVSRDSGFQVHNTVSSRVLNTRGSYTVPGQAMMGLTASGTRAEITLDGPSLQDPSSGRECIAPRVTVELSYQPVDIYVAREFHPQSCSFREVYAHEIRHVQIYREQLPRIEQLVREELEQRYAGRPLFAPLGQGLDRLEQQVDSWLRPLIKQQMAKVEALQLALDSPEESFRLSHTCMGQTALAMGSSF